MPESLVLPEVNLVSESSSNAPTRSKVDLSSTMEPSTPASVSSSPRPVRDSSWLQVDLCRDFQRDTCPRGHTCRFAHPQSRTIIVKDGKVTCCYDFLKDRCQRPLCKYYHPPVHIKEKLVCAGRQFGAMMSTSSIVMSTQVMATTTCAAYHNGAATVFTRDSAMVPPPAPLYHDRIQMCPDFIAGYCAAPLCPYAHPGPYVRQNRDQTVTICHNFMKWGCARGEMCRFYHPLPHQVMGPMVPFPGGPFKPGQAVPNVAQMPIPPTSMPPVVFPMMSLPFPAVPASPMMQVPTSGFLPLPATGGAVGFPQVFNPPIPIPQPQVFSMPVDVGESNGVNCDSSTGIVETE